MKRACVNLTTSRVTSRLMGIKLLYRMMNVSRLYAKLVEMSPAQTHMCVFTHTGPTLIFVFFCSAFVICASVFLPARDRYQQASSVCSLFQMAAPTELTRAMTSRMPNRTKICMLVTRSTLERFSGALVEFWKDGQERNMWGSRGLDELRRKQDIIASVDSVLGFTCINLESWPV